MPTAVACIAHNCLHILSRNPQHWLLFPSSSRWHIGVADLMYEAAMNHAFLSARCSSHNRINAHAATAQEQ
jgi:hypothetical protein